MNNSGSSSADLFCWTHGLTDETLRGVVLATFDVNSHAMLKLLVFGGYLYFNKTSRKVVAVNAVCPQYKMCCYRQHRSLLDSIDS